MTSHTDSWTPQSSGPNQSRLIKVLIGILGVIAVAVVALAVVLVAGGGKGEANSTDEVPATTVPAPFGEQNSDTPMLNPEPPAVENRPEAVPPVPGAYPGGGGPRPATAVPLPTYTGRYSNALSAHLVTPTANIGCDFNAPDHRGGQGLCGVVSFNSSSSPLGTERLGGQQKGKWVVPFSDNRIGAPTASSGTTGWMNQPANDGYQVPIVEYGKQYYFQDWVCASEMNGLTCWNTTTGSGVFLSREKVERFDGPATPGPDSPQGQGLDIVFGSTAPNGRGLGESRPSTIYYGSDPTGRVMDVTWSSWGEDRAEGNGLGNWRQPGIGTFETPAEVVAFDPGSCGGKTAYRKAAIYFPSKGEVFDPSNFVEICFTER